MFFWCLGALALLGLCLAVPNYAAGAADTLPDRIQFDRDIRPILSENCFACHGPDKGKRKAKLRLDTQDGALADHDGRRPIVPGDLAKSELYRRITSTDEDEHMPPPESGKKLTERQIKLLKRWIEQKAQYGGLWSFTPPQRPPLPAVQHTTWPKNAVDNFILARLEREGLKPSPEADKTTLIRRVTLDLTGLPPTPAEVDAFLSDQSPNAYEKVVDRLLASPHYGERMAVEWLDAARFADTHGFHIDAGRDMTLWRDWVINAFNRNMPFDQFTIDQLAGDLLPNSTTDQRIASGFNRNNMITFEGGAIPEEFLTTYIVDRVNTTATVWLGLTVACTQCHDHKYDPLTQRDFYRLYAFFHNVPENPIDGSRGNASPVLKVPTSQQKQKLDQLAADVKKIEARLAGPISEADAAQAEWETAAVSAKKNQWATLDPADFKSAGGAILSKLADKSIRATGTNPASETYTVTVQSDLKEITAIRLEILPDDSLVAKGPGRSGNGNIVLTGVRINGSSQNSAALRLKAASADFSQDGYPIAGIVGEKKRTSWAIYPEVGKSHFAVFEFETPIRQAVLSPFTITLDFKSQSSQHQPGRFRLSATNSSNPHDSQKLPANITQILVVAPEQRNDAQKTDLRKYYRDSVSPELKAIRDELAKLKKSQAEIDAAVPTTMVMQEVPKMRETHVLIRGQYDKKGDTVTAGVPVAFPQLPPDVPANRLGLARWLVSPTHPLTSRVIVNRYWQMYFGTGIVKTAEDFGSQGEWPIHPELLDWLATEFIGSGWNVKAMQRLIVTSATYRQASAATPELLAKDPEDRLLAHAPRLRLPAEFVRDLALAASGLLNDSIGGHSVSPYQPTGLWEELMSRADGANWTAQVYKQSHGQDLYRRGLYTFWKRTSPPPSLITFDAPDREVCTVRRARTNTPLQALVLLNDPTYVEASRKLAERMMTEGGASADARIAFAFRIATARLPHPKEAAVLRRIFDAQLDVYKKDPEAARKLLAIGESKRNEQLDPAELAAWTMTASVMLNLDETITKG
jgi:hypothetical protein